MTKILTLISKKYFLLIKCHFAIGQSNEYIQVIPSWEY